jgi:glycine betaine/proline transport system substrate-binding protein
LCFALTLGVAAALLTACGQGDDDGFAAAEGGGDRTVRLVQQPWADLIVENEIAKQVLDKLGYKTSVKDLSVPLGAQALSSGQADGYLANWWPSQKSAFEKPLREAQVEVAGTLMTGTQYAPAVPTSMATELGIRSLADLDRHGDKFGREIIGIEPGTPGNKTIADAIKDDAYGLGDWKLVQSSTEAMLAEVTRRVDRDQPVVFLAWSPHWMTVEWELTFLEDPENVWPGAGEIRVLVRKGLKKDDPNLYRFLSQIRVDTETAGAWIYTHDKEKKSPEEIARDWIKDNPDVLRTWLDGVVSVDGKPAAEVVAGKA